MEETALRGVTPSGLGATEKSGRSHQEGEARVSSLLQYHRLDGVYRHVYKLHNILIVCTSHSPDITPHCETGSNLDLGCYAHRLCGKGKRGTI